MINNIDIKELKALEDIDLKYYPGFDFNNDVSHNCDAYGCDSICRCGVIENVEMLPSIRFWDELLETTSLSKDPLTKLLVCHYLQNNFDRMNLFDYDAGGGYYGEELYKITFQYSSVIQEFLIECDGSYSKMIEKILQGSYSKTENEQVLNLLEAESNWKIIEISSDQIFENPYHIAAFKGDINYWFAETFLISVEKIDQKFKLEFFNSSFSEKDKRELKDKKFKIIVPTEL